MILNLLGYILLPAIGLALYRMGYEAGRQAARDEPEDWGDGPVVMEHSHGGDGDDS